MSDLSRCSIRDCTEPKCPESKFWCRKHYLEFRVAGMARENATLPNYARNGKHRRPISASSCRRVRPYVDDQE